MTGTIRSVLRLSPEDEQSLLALIHRTSARSKADVVRRALELMAWMWDLHLLGASFAVHDSEGEIYTIQLGRIVDGGAAERSGFQSLIRNLQLRLRDDHQVIIDRLMETGAAASRSAAVRAAIQLYRKLVVERQHARFLFAVFPDGRGLSRIPVPIPGIVSVGSRKSASAASKDQAIIPEGPLQKREPAPVADSATPPRAQSAKRKNRGMPPRAY